MTRDSKESTLARWSRRKLESRQTPEDEARPAVSVDTATGAPRADAEVAAAEAPPPLTDADMPDIESLSEESDFSPFMSPGVSDELRNLALRKLFHAPLFNIRDGLDEYDDDFTSFEKLGGIVTSDMKHRIEMEREKLREKLAAENETGEARADAEEGAEQDFDEDAIEEFDDEIETETLAAADNAGDVASVGETKHEQS